MLKRLGELRSEGCISEKDYKEFLNRNERCENCTFFHRLKHNFEAEIGFEESNCCDVLLHLPDSTNPWVQEVSRLDRCEMFTETKQAETTVTTKQLEEMYEKYQKKL